MSRLITVLFYNLFLIMPSEILLKFFGRFHKKVGEGLKVRKGWEATLQREIKRVGKGPRILFHVASAGELQQALPLITLIKCQYPKYNIGISFYSISGYSFFKGDDSVSFVTYLPFDSPRNSRLFMSIVKPEIVVVAAYDTWLNHCLAAHNIGAKLILISGILSADSSRLTFPLRGITRETFKLFHHLFLVSEGDKQAFESLGVSEQITVAGDSRYDLILSRIADAETLLSGTYLPKWEDSIVMTLGSVWELGWEIIGPPLLNSVSNGLQKLFVAPHEMHEEFLQQIEQSCVCANIAVKRYSQLTSIVEGEAVSVIIIDTVGLLASLYSRSSLAYIGGAFGKGVHNVAEPAAFGLPLYFGGNYSHSMEARLAVENNGGVVVTSAQEFEDDLSVVLNSSSLLNERGENARKVICDNAGASEKIMKELSPVFLTDD